MPPPVGSAPRSLALKLEGGGLSVRTALRGLCLPVCLRLQGTHFPSEASARTASPPPLPSPWGPLTPAHPWVPSEPPPLPTNSCSPVPLSHCQPDRQLIFVAYSPCSSWKQGPGVRSLGAGTLPRALLRNAPSEHAGFLRGSLCSGRPWLEPQVGSKAQQRSCQNPVTRCRGASRERGCPPNLPDAKRMWADFPSQHQHLHSWGAGRGREGRDSRGLSGVAPRSGALPASGSGPEAAAGSLPAPSCPLRWALLVRRAHLTCGSRGTDRAARQPFPQVPTADQAQASLPRSSRVTGTGEGLGPNPPGMGQCCAPLPLLLQVCHCTCTPTRAHVCRDSRLHPPVRCQGHTGKEAAPSRPPPGAPRHPLPPPDPVVLSQLCPHPPPPGSLFPQLLANSSAAAPVHVGPA